MTSATKAHMRDLKSRIVARTASVGQWQEFGRLTEKHPRIARLIVDDYYRSIGEEPWRNPCRRRA